LRREGIEGVRVRRLAGLHRVPLRIAEEEVDALLDASVAKGETPTFLGRIAIRSAGVSNVAARRISSHESEVTLQLVESHLTQHVWRDALVREPWWARVAVRSQPRVP